MNPDWWITIAEKLIDFNSIQQKNGENDNNM